MAKDLKSKPKMGRPPKADKFDAHFSFPCHQTLLDALETYRASNGLRSVGEAVRFILANAVKKSQK